MKTSKKVDLKQDEWGTLIALTAVIMGGVLRFIPVLNAPFPISDGGMFYTLIIDILKNNFTLPQTTTYNQLSIPFVYPPLGFYLAAGLKQFFNIAPIISIAWFPPVMATLCIVAVYKLANTLTQNPIKAGLAALCYALVPLSSTWVLMGGGLTRALGFFFLLLTINNAYLLFNSQQKYTLLKTIFWGSLTVLSHPEMALQTIGISLLFLALARNIKNLLNAFKVAGGVLLLTSAWWVNVLQNHGLGPFLEAPKTGFYSLIWIIYHLGLLKMVVEENLTIVSLAGILGLVVVLTRKEFVIPLFILTLYLVDPRNANTLAMVPLSILAATGILDLLTPALKNIALPPKGWFILAGYLILISIVGSYGKMMQFAQNRVQNDHLAAMQWVKENTSPDKRFFVITGNATVFEDPITEWFPALTERQNIGTIQGREWLKGEQFFPYGEKVQGMQFCYWQDSACLESQQAPFPAFDYLFLPKQCSGEPNCLGDLTRQISPLYLSLRQSNYQLVFENNLVAIFAKDKR